MTTDRLLALEEQTAHLSRAVEDLSHIVTAQADAIDSLNHRVALLMDRARDQRDSDGGGGVILGDERPPHY